jgi:FKBP-type peptidyl-prolyl cis-trans isomerase FkpA
LYLAPLKKIKMNRFLKVFSLVAIIALLTFFAACGSDDDVKIAPPRDFTAQNTADMDSINKFLDTHYIVLNETTLEATFPEITEGVTELSIRAQQVYPLKSKVVRRNGINYEIFYLTFRQGVSDAPCGVDYVTINYRGTLLDGTQFDYSPVVGGGISLDKAVSGWQDIIPLFNSGTFVSGTEGGQASYIDFGAGAMFLPSGLAYFNGTPSNLVPAYSPLVFSFQLFDVTYTDIDGDKILNKDEFEWQKEKDAQGNVVINPETGLPNWIRIDVVFSDTDGDGLPNYADVDDDDDGRLTKDEIRKTDSNGYPLPTEYWTYAEMFMEDGVTVKTDFKCGDDSDRNGEDQYSNVPKYMDSGCKGGAISQDPPQ